MPTFNSIVIDINLSELTLLTLNFHIYR